MQPIQLQDPETVTAVRLYRIAQSSEEIQVQYIDRVHMDQKSEEQMSRIFGLIETLNEPNQLSFKRKILGVAKGRARNLSMHLANFIQNRQQAWKYRSSNLNDQNMDRITNWKNQSTKRIANWKKQSTKRIANWKKQSTKKIPSSRDKSSNLQQGGKIENLQMKTKESSTRLQGFLSQLYGFIHIFYNRQKSQSLQEEKLNQSKLEQKCKEEEQVYLLSPPKLQLQKQSSTQGAKLKYV